MIRRLVVVAVVVFLNQRSTSSILSKLRSRFKLKGDVSWNEWEREVISYHLSTLFLFLPSLPCYPSLFSWPFTADTKMVKRFLPLS